MVQIVTNRWTTRLCDSTCGQETQRIHIHLLPECKPKTNVGSFIIVLREEDNCEYVEELHSHYPKGMRRSIPPSDLPASLKKVILGERQCPLHTKIQEVKHEEEGETINMMVEGTGCIEFIKDDREDKNYIAEYFTCGDDDCPILISEHRHLFNMDPTYPDYPI